MSGEKKTIQEVGKKGGDKTMERYGLEHYRILGQKSKKKLIERYGPDAYKVIRLFGKKNAADIVPPEEDPKT